MHILPSEMMQEMLNNCPMGFLVLSSSHHIIDINKHGASLFDYAPDEMIGQEFSKFVSAADHKSHVSTYNNDPHSTELLHQDASGISKSGRTIRLEVKVDKLSNGMAYAVFYRASDFQTGDKLTGAMSRDQLTTIIDKFPEDFKYSVLFMDLNDFKLVNDKLGHNTGDLVLSVVGKRVANMLRDSDYFCRWGGDEFIVVIPGDLLGAAVVSAKIKQKISEMITIPEGNVHIGCSIGIAASHEGETFKEVLAIADERMYNDKVIT